MRPLRRILQSSTVELVGVDRARLLILVLRVSDQQHLFQHSGVPLPAVSVPLDVLLVLPVPSLSE